MDDSIYYSLQNENIAKDAEIAALKRKIDDLKQEVGPKNGLPFQYTNVGDRVWYLFPLWDFGLRRVVWEMAGDHKFFADREGICILFWVNKNEVGRFKAVKSEYVFEEREYAERARDELNKRDKEKTYEEWKGVRDAYNPKFPV